MSNAPQTITIGRTTYSATPSKLGYTFTGPRGGTLDGIRNVHSGVIYVMQGARTIARLSDAGGEWRHLS